jgi:6-phosphogluconate dehydrogenase
MPSKKYQFGMVGLGTMGRNFLLNMADHGFSVAGYDLSEPQVSLLKKETGSRDILATSDKNEFLASLKSPRKIMMLVPAGGPVDSVIHALLPGLNPGDVLIDGGNSYFKDTDRRFQELAEQRVDYLGVGVSGGEKGARFGASLMVGGEPSTYDKVKEGLTVCAAKYDGEPCISLLGPRSAGHYVKMVHNGIEYALMQLIAEAYDLMKRGMGMSAPEIAEEFQQMADGPAGGYLLEISAGVFRKLDPVTGSYLIDFVSDDAKQLGTGKWTSQSAMDLGIPVPIIDSAVMQRHMSGLKMLRTEIEQVVGLSVTPIRAKKAALRDLRLAMQAAMILSFDQGLLLLGRASDVYGYGLNKKNVCAVWRAGCIIRSKMLDQLVRAYDVSSQLPSLLIAPDLMPSLERGMDALKRVVGYGVSSGVPLPAFSAGLAYDRSMRSAWLPANLVQALRDTFGAHQYERIDQTGTFHTEWITEND